MGPQLQLVAGSPRHRRNRRGAEPRQRPRFGLHRRGHPLLGNGIHHAARCQLPARAAARFPEQLRRSHLQPLPRRGLLRPRDGLLRHGTPFRRHSAGDAGHRVPRQLGQARSGPFVRGADLGPDSRRLRQCGPAAQHHQPQGGLCQQIRCSGLQVGGHALCRLCGQIQRDGIGPSDRTGREDRRARHRIRCRNVGGRLETLLPRGLQGRPQGDDRRRLLALQEEVGGR